MAKWPQELLDRMDVATHIHTKADLPEHECQGKLSLEDTSDKAIAAGLDGIALSEHTTNPGVGLPHKFGDDSELAIAIRDRNKLVRDFNPSGLVVFSGAEANIIGGEVDIPEATARDCDWIIASMHGSVPDTAAGIERALKGACEIDYVTAIGHPTRYAESIHDVPWASILKTAANPESPTLVELNYNAFHTYGPLKQLREYNDKGGKKESLDGYYWNLGFWYRWLGLVADSGAAVIVSLDVHDGDQWPQATQSASWMPTTDQVMEFYGLIEMCGISGNRIVNNELDFFSDWIKCPKEKRGQLITW